MGKSPPKDLQSADLQISAEVQRNYPQVVLANMILSHPEHYTIHVLADLYHAIAQDDPGRLLDEMLNERPCENDLKRNATERLQICDRIEHLLTCDQKIPDNPREFFDKFVWMVDPRTEDDWQLALKPFVLFDIQVQMLDFLVGLRKNKEFGLQKKSRDLGASIIACGTSVYWWLKETGIAVLLASRKAEYVTKKYSLDALLERCAFIIDYLPHWMRPDGYDRKTHYTEGLIRHPMRPNQIRGEIGANTGRAGRSTITIFDEYSYAEQQQEIHDSLRGTTRAALFIYTSAGPGTYAAHLERQKTHPTMVIPWYHDPRKHDDPSHAGKPTRSKWFLAHYPPKMSEVGWGREYACDDGMAQEGGVIPNTWMKAAMHIHLIAGGEIKAGLDLASKSDRSVLIIRKGGVILVHKRWEGKDWNVVAREIKPILEDLGSGHLTYDRGGHGSAFAKEIARIGWPQSWTIAAVTNNTKPSARRYEDEPMMPARKRFVNLGTELWWSLRLRIRRSYEREIGIAHHHDDDCIRIPHHEDLERMLVSRKYEERLGKIVLEEKPRGERGISPDDADALVLCEMWAPPAKRGRNKSSRRTRTSTRKNSVY